jgi:hypothetical protein
MNRLVRRCESVCSAKACSDEHLTPSSEWLFQTADSQINIVQKKIWSSCGKSRATISNAQGLHQINMAELGKPLLEPLAERATRVIAFWTVATETSVTKKGEIFFADPFPGQNPWHDKVQGRYPMMEATGWNTQ